eukprot:Trichotokara_eunicae@DN10704_c0_g1_i1.p1
MMVDPPQRPALLTAEEVGSVSVKVAWNAPIVDPALVAGYRIFRDETPLMEVSEDTHSYLDTGLMGLTEYVYTVRALNKLKVEGPPSDKLKVKTAEPGRPSAPQSIRVASHSTSHIELRWQKPADHGGAPIVCYRIYRNGELLGIHQAAFAEESWTDPDVESNSNYVYHVAAVNRIT